MLTNRSCHEYILIGNLLSTVIVRFINTQNDLWMSDEYIKNYHSLLFYIPIVFYRNLGIPLKSFPN